MKKKNRRPSKPKDSPFRFDAEDSTAPLVDVNYVTSSQQERKCFLQVSFVNEDLKDEFQGHCAYLGISMNERLRHLIRKDLSWHRKRRIRLLRDRGYE